MPLSGKDRFALIVIFIYRAFTLSQVTPRVGLQFMVNIVTFKD